MFGIHGYWLFVLSAILLKIAPGQDTPLNPKVALFFLALMPQFISAGSTNKVGAFLALGLSFVTLGLAWCTTLAIAASHLRKAFLRRPSLASWMNRVAGTMFIALGLRLATTRQ